MAKPANQLHNLQHQAEQLLLHKFCPAAVLVNGEGDILYINGCTVKYLEPAAGKANWNIYAMAREGLRHELAIALKKALRQQSSITLQSLPLSNTEDKMQRVNVTVHAIEQPELLHGMALIAFTDDAAERKDKRHTPAAHGSEKNTELERALEQIRILREEMQTSQEELTSTNEELQSTNEELTTSKEEMQSLNEELQTVNAELQSKVDDLSSMNNDMKNLLNSTDIATMFLDNALNVRRFTNQATQLFKLIPGDVGRPLSDIVNELRYPGLQADAQAVLHSLVFSEKQIAARDGRWYKVRIMPYRTLENVIDGVIITFSDITEAKTLEAELRSRQYSSTENEAKK